ncbi:hypothetical protein DM01DRAFT_1336251 [Hesseltinella vesiculosa]|uniref:J domain-containing protein n=1 Tax=Hesseltinella vesiculosa TaxID=101127 RepID=A0A1X2GG17_9FUNG|nr:hypothetical protein DM01DRAFT_1336251 [Hesseltinella vesiculosa]
MLPLETVGKLSSEAWVIFLFLDCTYKKIKQAYDIVGDPVERAKYERWRLSGLQIPFEDFRQLSQHAQNVHWQALPSPLMLTDTSSESSGAQPSTFKPTSSDRLPRIHIQKQSFWSKPDAYDKFRNYTLDTHDYK